MAEQLRVVIAERPRLHAGTIGPEQVIYHLPDGPDQGDGWFQPVKCGGGITLHGRREKVARSAVCKDCLTGTKTL